MNLASIPSPSTAVWHLDLGFISLPLRAYALCIVAGIVVACIVTDRRMRSRGAPPWIILDVAVWAVPFGIIGARIYHVLSSPAAYFGEGGDLVRALYIWEGGLGIWGGVAGGAVGALLACRQLGMPLSFVADTVAVGLPLAQAIGRFGNWFNNELYGKRSDDLPWGLQVHRMSSTNPGRAETGPDGQPLLEEGLYHPTFLYEALWNVGTAGLVFWLDRKFKFGKGRAFALYVMLYTLGRVWIEALRVDPAERILGLRLNVWTSILVFAGAAIFFLLRKGPREYLIPLQAVEGEQADGKPAHGFLVVTEEQFEAYQADGTVPEPRTPAVDSAVGGGAAGDDPARDDPADDPAFDPVDDQAATKTNAKD